MPKPKISDSTKGEVGRYLKAEIDGGKSYDEQKSKDRQMADRLYLAKRLGKARRGKSQVVSSDVHDAIETVLPDLLEIFASGDEPVTIKPRPVRRLHGGQDQPGVDPVSDPAATALVQDPLHLAMKDALLYRNGYLKWGLGLPIPPG